MFRILPPFGEASNGYPYRKWQIIWGLSDPETGRARPFASSMTSEKRCPVTEYVTALKDKAEVLKSQLKAAGASEEDVKQRLKVLSEVINSLTPKTVYVYNAADKAGEVGLLELKSTAHKSMKEQMNKYIQEYNQDPTSLNSAEDDSGIWFNVIRSGTHYDTTYKVEKLQTLIKNGNQRTYVDDRSPLPDSVVHNYDNLAYDLSSIYQIKSYDELDAILQANLPQIYGTCPEADLSAALNADAVVATTTTAQNRPVVNAQTVNKAVKPAARVNLNLADEDDSLVGLVTKSATASKSVFIDDDFMREADEILNA